MSANSYVVSRSQIIYLMRIPFFPQALVQEVVVEVAVS